MAELLQVDRLRAGYGEAVVLQGVSFSLDEGAVLEKGCVYLVPLMERLALPPGLEGVANAKSSTGRLDLLTRTICDGGTEFDRVPEGYHGPLWAEICPRSFSVLVRPGMRLNQLRLRDGDARLSDAELRALAARAPEAFGTIDEGLAFSVDLSDERVGWRARPHAGVIDLGRLDRVLEVDATSRAARVQGGVLGPHLEDQLRPHGLTLRHFPQSFEFSTLGGWLATRAGGHFATLHTRIDETIARVVGAVEAGNVYVNRNMIGAVVGTQPFGGQGLSGTGPKAGGPNYLKRFAAEQVVSVNTSAAGGNAALLAMEE